MKEKKIEHLAYVLKEAKKNNRPQPIFFLGAGASRTGNIPLASEIKSHILKQYLDNPNIKSLPLEKQTYAELMDCLEPEQRDELLRGYINKAHINVTHIYLAQLIKEGFADYVLTVNFDNLMLRALALFNIFPATYDMAILKDLTTTTFKEKSVVYLHGQSHGLWLLNTGEEMGKVATIIPRIFDSIKNKRPWVFIGYSGADPIFEHIKGLGRFDNGLYWVTFNKDNPDNKVMQFLETSNTNASLIRGYDSDSFMLKLSKELGLPEPDILDKPFSALKVMLNNIVDIDEQEHFKGVKERLEIARRQVDEAIGQYEIGSTAAEKEGTQLDLLKKEIINLIITQDYPEDIISDIEERSKNFADDNFLNELLAGLYSDWGVDFGDMAKNNEGKEAEDLYNQAFEKYKKATEIKPDLYAAFNNWGADLNRLAKRKEGKEVEELYLQAIEKLKKATEIEPDYFDAFFNFGYSLNNLAKRKKGKEAEDLYLQAFEKYKKATEIKPDSHEAFNNWGTNLGNLAKIKEGREAEDLYLQAIDKFQKATEIKPDYPEAFNNWGASLSNLAKSKGDKETEKLYLQAIDKFQKAIELGGGKYYNLARLYASTGNKKDALFYLDLSLQKEEKSISSILSDNAWYTLLLDKDFNEIIKKYSPL